MKVRIKIMSLDIFPNDAYLNYANVHQGRLATRIYFLMMIIFLLILIVYTAQSKQRFSMTIQSPNLKLYEELHEHHFMTLQCSCPTISIPYRKFIQITPMYHQLCFSPFIEPDWYQSLDFLLLFTDGIEFGAYAASYFRALAFFCTMVRETFETAYE